MIRISTIFTILILAVLAAITASARYQAEVQVKNQRIYIAQTKERIVQERDLIKTLRAEIAYLEGPERLSDIAERATSLGPVAGAQLMTADDFAVAIGAQDTAPDRYRVPGDAIKHAIALADASLVQ